jgi:peptide deformylase
MFEVLLYGNPVLRLKAQTVTTFDKKLGVFAQELAETMVAQDGLGLAANQVGSAIRVIAVDESKGENPALILANPEVIWSSNEKEEFEEGCLSLPEIHIKVTRPVSVTVQGQDVSGKAVVIEKAAGMLARALQHEIDHLNGKMIIDYASPLQRQMLNSTLKKMAKAKNEPQPA